MEDPAKSSRSENSVVAIAFRQLCIPMAQKSALLFSSDTGYNPKLEFFNYGDIHCPNRSGRSACH